MSTGRGPEEDLTIAGPVLVNLFVSSTGTDADFFVKLIDVFPGDLAEPGAEADPKMGQQMLVGVEVMQPSTARNAAAKRRSDAHLLQYLGQVSPRKGHRVGPDS